MHLTADTRYQLFVDGERVGWGAPQGPIHMKYYDTREVSLEAGEHCLGAIVYHIGFGRFGPETSGGFLLEMEDGEGGLLLGTDATWRCCRSQAWRSDTYCYWVNKRTPYQEIFDARKFDESWNEIEYDDSAWGHAFEMDIKHDKNQWLCLIARDIPFLDESVRRAEMIAQVEEALWLEPRTRNDLSISLSQAGRPLQLATLEHAESLTEEDVRAVVCCSTEHMNGFFDGMYDPCVVLDFGQVINAIPRIEIDGPEGASVEIGYAERLVDGRFNNAIETGFADAFFLREGRQQWQPSAWRSFRYLKVRFKNFLRPSRIYRLDALEMAFPFREQGGFESGDEMLNDTFRISRETVRLCSMENYMDTPWREGAQWLGDAAAVTIGATYACYGDTRLASKYFRQTSATALPTGLLANMSLAPFASDQRVPRGTIADFSLWWGMALWKHFLYTGEARWLHEFYADVLRIFRYHLHFVNEQGLIEDMPGWVFIEWAPLDNRGVCAHFNAIFAGFLKAVEAIAAYKGDEWTAQTARQLYERIRGVYHETFFDPSRGVYADAVHDGCFSEVVSEHTLASAVNFGLCPSEHAPAMIDTLFGQRSVAAVEAQPFFTSVVLQALDRVGRMDLALELIRRRWGGRMVARGVTSCSEEWGENGSWRNGKYQGFMRSNSHAWSACPAEFLIKNLGGIRVLEPGCRKLQVVPRTTDFPYRVSYPTPLGPVRIVSDKDGVEIDVPEGMELVREPTEDSPLPPWLS